MPVIRFDDGTKYTSKKFNKFCENEGIEHQLTAPYTPQQNGSWEEKQNTYEDDNVFTTWQRATKEILGQGCEHNNFPTK